MSNPNDPKNKDFSNSEKTVLAAPVVAPTPIGFDDDDESTMLSPPSETPFVDAHSSTSSESSSPFFKVNHASQPSPPQFGAVEETRLVENPIAPPSPDSPAIPPEQFSSSQSSSPYASSSPFSEMSRSSEVQTPQREPASPFSKMTPASQAQKFDEDVSSERTVLHGSLPSVEAAQLVVISGVLQDQKFPVSEDIVSFGREKDNVISFPDPTVSRYHFKIHRTKGTHFELEDLGSGNGTVINGKRYKNKTVTLKHGDKIQVGKSILQFLIVGKPLPEAQKSSFMLVVGLLIGFLILGGGGIFAYLYLVPKNTQKDSSRQVADLLEQSNELAAQRRWREAKIALQKALRFNPRNLLIQQRILEITAEEKAELFLRKAKLFYKTKEYRDALTAIRQADKVLTAGSVYADEIWNLRFKIEKKLHLKITQRPSMKCFWKKRQGWLFKCCPVKGKTTPQCQKVRKVRRRDTKNLPSPDVATSTATSSGAQQALNMYNLGRLEEAIKLLKKSDPSNLLAKVEHFKEVYQKGKIQHNQRNPSGALGPLIEALQLDQEISQGQSRFSRQIKMMLANMYAIKGVLALSSHQPCLAFRSFQEARKYNRNHLLAKGKLKFLEEFAAKKLNAALKILKTERSLSKKYLRTAMCTVPHSHSIFIKAKKTLDSL